MKCNYISGLIIITIVVLLSAYIIFQSFGYYIAVILLTAISIILYSHKKNGILVISIVGVIVAMGIPFISELVYTFYPPKIIVLVDEIESHDFSFDMVPMSMYPPPRLISIYLPNNSVDVLIRSDMLKMSNFTLTPKLLKPSFIRQPCNFENGEQCYFYTISVINSGGNKVEKVDVNLLVDAKRIEVGEWNSKIDVNGGSGVFGRSEVGFVVNNLESFESQMLLLKSSNFSDVNVKCYVNGRNRDCDYFVFHDHISEWPKIFELYIGQPPLFLERRIDHPSVGNNFTYEKAFIFNYKTWDWEEVELP